MELFCNNGHFTKEAYHLLLYGEPDELQRLEMAEHLSFCDVCVEKYTQYLTQDVLMSPVEPMEKGVLAKIKNHAQKMFLNRYATVAAAACFAVVLWTSGMFMPTHLTPKEISGVAAKTNEFTMKTEEFTRNITNGMLNIFDHIEWKGVLRSGEK